MFLLSRRGVLWFLLREFIVLLYNSNYLLFNKSTNKLKLNALLQSDILIYMSSIKDSLQTRLDIESLYNKGRKNIGIDQQHNKNVINLLKYAQILVDRLQNTPQKNGQVYSQFHKSFKNLRSKMVLELTEIGEEAGQMGQAVRKTLNQIIDQLGAKARRYEEGQKRMKELGRLHVQSEEQSQQLQQAVKQQMLQLLRQFKDQAVSMGKDLEKDNKVIQNISSKQQKVYKSLQKQTKNVKQLNNSNPLGFFTLIGYSAIAVVVWLFTLIFIILF